MRIYLAGPMHKPFDCGEYLDVAKEASRIEGALVSAGHHVFNPYSAGLHPGNFNIDRDIWQENFKSWVLLCDAIVLIEPCGYTWKDSRGCAKEMSYGVPVIQMHGALAMGCEVNITVEECE